MDWIRPRTLAASLIAAALFGVPATSAQDGALPADLIGRRVVAVRLVGESGILQTNPSGLPLQPGDPFTLDAERESLRQLFRTGLYADLVAEVVPVPDGVRLDFIVTRNFYVNNVQITGLREPPSESQALSAMRLGLGEVFRESDMPDVLDRLRQLLEQEGYYEAKISYELSPDSETRQMDIAIQIEPGPRARAGAVTLVNDTPFREAQLRDRLGLEPGAEITSERLNTRTERLRRWMADRGYLGARTGVMRGTYDAETRRIPLEVRVTAGPAIQVRVEGADISSGTLRRLLPIYEEGAVDEDLLQEGRRNLRDYLQGEGYFDADVNFTVTEAPGEGRPEEAGAQTITYEVTLGAKRRLVGIAFEGNEYFGDSLLRSRVRIQPAAFASPGRFSTAQLTGDVASLRDLYQANGFRQVQVSTELIENYLERPGDLFVRFLIQEGRQTRVADLQIEGNEALSDDFLLSVIGSTPGQPFSDFNVAGDRDNILALYYDLGFPEARFRATVEEVSAGDATEGPRVSLVYHLEEGPQFRVARVLISGYEHTRRGVIAREVQLEPGEPLSQGAVVETQRRLYDLGIFSRVAIAPQNPAGTERDKTLSVLVEEAQRYSIAYGGGFEAQRLGGAGTDPVGGDFSFSPRGILEITKLNFTGRADTLSLKMRASTLQGRALLSYTSSNYFGWPNVSLQVIGLADRTRNVLTFTSTSYEGSAQITNRLSLTSSLAFRYAYRRVEVSDLRVDPEQIQLFRQPTRVSLFGVSWLRDRRDNVAEATRGTFNTISVDLAGKPIASSASFLRALFQNSTYTRIGSRMVFARSTRIGLQTPIGDTLSQEIPLPERFFAGGGTTLRGFGLNQAGPRDPTTGFPVGGMAMLVFNQELRFPMRLPFVGSRLGGAFFYDAGNVFRRFGDITLRTAPKADSLVPGNPDRTNNLAYFSHTVGFELRYRTPVGPVSVDLGYQLNPARFLVCQLDPCTNPTPADFTTSRLPHFQFFINLGSTF